MSPLTCYNGKNRTRISKIVRSLEKVKFEEGLIERKKKKR